MVARNGSRSRPSAHSCLSPPSRAAAGRRAAIHVDRPGLGRPKHAASIVRNEDRSVEVTRARHPARESRNLPIAAEAREAPDGSAITPSRCPVAHPPSISRKSVVSMTCGAAASARVWARPREVVHGPPTPRASRANRELHALPDFPSSRGETTSPSAGARPASGFPKPELASPPKDRSAVMVPERAVITDALLREPREDGTSSSHKAIPRGRSRRETQRPCSRATVAALAPRARGPHR